MTPIVGTFLSILSSLTGQLGPNYDPLFYDVMIYIFGTMMFNVSFLELSHSGYVFTDGHTKTTVRDGSTNWTDTLKEKVSVLFQTTENTGRITTFFIFIIFNF